jgi:putative oxidoreductase
MRDFHSNQIDIGLLILRIGVGAMFVFHHGLPKLLGGPERWERLGAAVGNFGIHFAPMLWGILSMLAEFGGGLLLISGLFFRPVAAVLAINMIVAASSHIARGEGLRGADHAIEIGIVFLALAFIGPGRYSLDRWLEKRRESAFPKLPA